MKEGKIIKAVSGFYYVASGDEVYQCRGRGIFRKNKVNPLVGDYVLFHAENLREGYLHEIKERKNELARPPIANVDQAVLVFSVIEPTFNPQLLDRFLVFVAYEYIEPIICLTKVDLASDELLEEMETYIKDYEKIGYEVLVTSTATEEGIERLVSLLKDKITVFAGQSGVGKSSLLNTIKPELAIKTAEISSHLGRGRHTTRHVELIEVAGGLVADTPGFSSLDFLTIEAEELGSCFPEIQKMSEHCRFRGCMHANEPGCAVKEAVETGEIPSYRYNHYKIFLEEIQDRKPRY